MTDEQRRHACEVRYWVGLHYPDGQAMNSRMNSIERRRGKEASDALRADARIEWAKRRTA